MHKGSDTETKVNDTYHEHLERERIECEETDDGVNSISTKNKDEKLKEETGKWYIWWKKLELAWSYILCFDSKLL